MFRQSAKQKVEFSKDVCLKAVPAMAGTIKRPDWRLEHGPL
jgi:hypothetical protein